MAGAAPPPPASLGRRVSPSPGDLVSQLSFAPQAPLLLASSWDCGLRVYDAALFDPPLLCAFWAPAPLLACCFAGDDCAAAASGGLDAAVRLHTFDAELSEELGRHGGGGGGGGGAGADGACAAASCVAHSARAGALLSAGWDSTMRLWDARSGSSTGGGATGGAQAACLKLPGKALSLAVGDCVALVAVSGRALVGYDVRALGRCLSGGGGGGTATLAEPPVPPLFRLDSPLDHPARRAAVSPCGTLYALAGTRGRVAVEPLPGAPAPGGRSAQPPQTQQQAQPQLPLQTAPPGGFSFKCHRTVSAPPGGGGGGAGGVAPPVETAFPVHALAFHPTRPGPCLATGGGDGCVVLWDLGTRRRVAPAPQGGGGAASPAPPPGPYPGAGGVCGLAYSANGALLAVASCDGWGADDGGGGGGGGGEAQAGGIFVVSTA